MNEEIVRQNKQIERWKKMYDNSEKTVKELTLKLQNNRQST